MTVRVRPFFATSISYCRFCDAVVENNTFKHDDDCKINVPGKYNELVPFWDNGRSGYDLSPNTTATAEQIKAHDMGKAIKEKLERKHKPPYPEIKGYSSLFANQRA